ncbi:MAG: sensor histidine kinase [Solirubrobacteraceae bacterium]
MARNDSAEGSVRPAILGAQALCVAFVLVELGRLAAVGDARSLVIGAAAVAVFLPLHLQHLRYGLRGLRPPHSAITLAVMVVVHAAALVLIGPVWTYMLAALATSGLIVLRPAWAAGLLVACGLASVAGSVAEEQAAGITGSHVDLVYGLLVRSVVQFALVRLVAGVYQLAIARDALAGEAAARERERLGDEVRAAVQRRSGRIQQTASRASRALDEPDLAAAMLALDQIVRLAAQALADLRRIVAETNVPAGATATAMLAHVAEADASPIGGALTTPRARRLAALVWVVYVPFPLLMALGALGFPGSQHPAAAAVAWTALAGVAGVAGAQTALGRRVRWGPALVVIAGVLSLGLLPVLGEVWVTAAPTFAATAALVLKGRARLLCVLTVVGVELADGIGVDIAHAAFDPAPALGLFGPLAANAWSGCYETVITIVGIGGLYAAARLVALVAELHTTRAAVARAGAEAERRRLSGDLHDLLGQNLTALSLKADLARRLARADRDRATAELDDVVRLANRQATELDAATRARRLVTFETELSDALRLLGAVGVSVDADVRLGELDPTTNAVLGWVIREGITNILRHATPTRCAIRATVSGDAICLELVNDGAHPAPGPPGTGLRSLAGRVSAANGTLAAQQRDGSFHLQVTLATLVPA